MASIKASTICCIFGFLLQSMVCEARASCGSAPPAPSGGGYPYGCSVPAPRPPPITFAPPPPPIAAAPAPPPIIFAPVPQPFPVRVPVRRPQSVTIPNIILALLPPTPKVPVAKPFVPPPVPRPLPIVLPIPRPYPVPVPDYGCAPPPC